MWWTSSCGRIELEMTLKQAQACTHPGPCDMDVAELSRTPKIRRQLAKVDRTVLANELRGYGAWDEHELADHDENLQRLLWLAAGDIAEEHARG